jgi:hypothetical protein
MSWTCRTTDYLRINPDLKTKIQFDRFVGNDREGFLHLRRTNIQGSKYQLDVKAPISHAGRQTKNRAIYQPREMRNGSSTFLKPYPLPVLLEHNSDAPPVGRFRSAGYVNTPHSLYGGADASLLDFAQTMKVFDAMRASGVVYDSSFPGLGHVETVARITDTDSIERFLDETYLTFSVSIQPDELYCCFCHKPFGNFWDYLFGDVEEDSDVCEHGPFAEVDGQDGFLVFGSMNFLEGSVVSIPADQDSIVSGMQIINSEGEVFPISDYLSKDSHSSVISGGSGNCSVGSDGQQSNTTVGQRTIQDSIQLIDGHYTMRKSKEGVNSQMKTNKDKVTEQSGQSASDTDVKVPPFDFGLITDKSAPEVFYAGLKLLMQSDGLSEEELKSLPGKAFAGPNRTLPIVDEAHVLAVKELFQKPEVKVSDQFKSKVLKEANRKADSLGMNTTPYDRVKAELATLLPQLSQYDSVELMGLVLADCKVRGFTKEDVADLGEFISISSAQEDAFKVEIDSLKQQVEVSGQVLGTLKAQSHQDNTHLHTVLSVIANPLTVPITEEDSYASMVEKHKDSLKDISPEDLVKQIKDHLESPVFQDNLFKFALGHKPIVDSTQVEDPTDKNSTATSPDTYRDSFLAIVKQKYSTLSAIQADSYLMQLFSTGAITKEEYQAISGEAKETE